MSEFYEGRPEPFTPQPHHLAVVCPAERKLIGWISGKPKDRVSKTHLTRHFEPEGDMLPNALAVANRDAAVLQCPTCRNALVLGLPDQDIADAIADDLRPVVGYFYLPDPTRMRKRFIKGQGTVSELRAEPSMRPTTDAEKDMPIDAGK